MVKYELHKLFDVFLDIPKVTDFDLSRAGFSSSRVKTIISQNIMFLSGDAYILNREYIQKLCEYGDMLVSNGDTLKGAKCYDLCMRLNPKSYVKHRKFLFDLKREHYKDALKYLDVFSMTFTDLSSFYLYMMSLVSNLPENYKIFVKAYKNAYTTNKIKITNDFKKVIRLCFHYSFNLALKELENIKLKKDYLFEKEICEALIITAKQKIVNLNSIYYFLTIGEIDTAVELTIDYLHDNGRGEYNRLVKALINLSSEFGENTYKLPMDILSNLDDIRIDYKYFVSMFNDAFNSKSIKKAKLVLKVLVELNRLGVCSLDLSGYEMSLGKIKK